MQILILFLGALLFLFNVLGQPPLFFNPEHRVHLSQSRGSEWLESLEQRYREKLDKRRALARELADNSGQTELLERYRQSIGEVSAVRGEAGEALRQENRVSSASNYDTNYIFPHFMLAHLPPVLLGLLIAAIFAAAMSSIDSVLNSLSAATIVDFYKRWWRPEASEPQALWAGRVTTLLWGIVATYAAFFFQGGGSIVEQINRVGSYFYGSLLGVFVLALVCRQAGPRAGFLGLIGGMTTVIAVHNTFRVEFLWYNIVGCLGVLVVGVIASRFERT